MAYKALYRVYRPKGFDDLVGQEHIVKTMQNAINENKISHAYLFCGPRGTGKTSMAKLLAKAINCKGDNKPCNECENCIDLNENMHPDVIEIDAASNNGVDEIRELIDKVKYAPIMGNYKVYIIDEVHMLSTGAFNALLKTLEEPPAHVIFILATTEPQKILPTIISRCQRFDFTKVADKNIEERLEIILKEENVSYEIEAIKMISRLAEGGMRDAISILEQCLAYSMNQLTVKDVSEVYSILSIDNKIKFVKTLLSKDVKNVLFLLKEMTYGGIDIKRLTYDLIDILKDIIIYKNTNDESLMFVLNKSHIDALSQYITAEECFTLIDILIDAIEHYKGVSNANTYFEIAALKITNQISGEMKKSVESNETFTVERREAYKEIDTPKTIETAEEVNIVNDDVVKEETQIDTFEEQIAETDSVDSFKIVTDDFKVEVKLDEKNEIQEPEEDTKENVSIMETNLFEEKNQTKNDDYDPYNENQISLFDDEFEIEIPYEEAVLETEEEILPTEQEMDETPVVLEELPIEPYEETDVNEEPFENKEIEIPEEETNDINQDTYTNPIEEEELIYKSHIEEVKLVDDEKDIQILESDILNILVQQDSKVFETVRERWPVVQRYLSNVNTAKYASMLCDAVPVAASQNGIILKYEHQAETNRVNNSDNYHELKKFISDIFGKDFDYIALTTTQCVDIRNYYLKLRQVGKLPKAQEIKLTHITAKKESKTNNTKQEEAIQYGIDIFGDLVKIVEDE